MSHMKEVFEQNKGIRMELENLAQRLHALQRQQKSLESHQRQLLQEREYVQKLHAQRVSKCSKYTPVGVIDKQEKSPKQ